jgi:hypothetical protein
MRGPYVHWSLKQALIAVAMAALLSTLGESYQGFHRAYWHAVAFMHAAHEWECRELASSRLYPRSRQADRQRADDHAQLKVQYESISSHPWSPIPRELSAPSLIHD